MSEGVVSVMRGARKLVAAVAALVVVAALGALVAYAATGRGNSSAAQYQYGKKVTLCHKHHTIRVNIHALPAHRRHGDTLGPCPGTTTGTRTGTTTTVTTTHGHGHGHGH